MHQIKHGPEPHGLTSAEAAARLSKYGYNELPSEKSRNILDIALEVMKEPMFFLLVGCGLLYTILGDYREGIVMVFAIAVIISITFYQHRKTEKALEALRKLSVPRVLVRRDGSDTRLPGRELVVGDLLLLSEGDRIPADARLMLNTSLNINESLLTGESLPVMKSATPDGLNAEIFSGTLIVGGSGYAEVTAIGTMTRFGMIGTSLKEIHGEETQLQAEMKTLIKRLFIVGVALCATVVAAFYLSSRNFLSSLLNGLAAAMAILPEEFPVVLTVFLALGAWRLSKKNVLTRRPSAIETLGSATVLCTDKTGTITKNSMEVAKVHISGKTLEKKDFETEAGAMSTLLSVARRASRADTRDPMENAILRLYEKGATAPQAYAVVKEYPISPECFAMTNVVLIDGQALACCKGAPEAVLKLCRLSPPETEAYMSAARQMAVSGLRVLGVAQAFVPAKHSSQADFHFGFLGLLAFEDPIRPEVPDAVAQCQKAGIRVVMITGDFPETAISIAAQIGMTSRRVLTGNELDILDDAELNSAIPDVHIFARVVPAQKLRIVRALKANKEIVAMTGDGVNDAPALKAADIGIAMGNKGTDVAREAASLVLTDDNFASIVGAIRSGRKIFDNLQKAMGYIIAIHIPIIVLVLLPAVIPSLPPLLLPLHIIFLELIIDPVCSIAFESEQEEKNIMSRPPRNPDEPFFGMKSIGKSIFKGLLLCSVALAVYFMTIHEGHTAGQVRAIAFSALVIGNIFLILTTLSSTRSFVSVFLEKNWAVAVILTTAMALLWAIISVPGLQALFGFEFPGYSHFLIAFAAAFALLLVLESIKLLTQAFSR